MFKDKITHVDMDGVICDWSKGFREISGGLNEKEYSLKYGKEAGYNLTRNIGIKFWSELDWMVDGKQLWNYITSNFLHVKILSALGAEDDNIEEGKLIWLNKHIPELTADEIILVVHGVDKAKYANKNSILIDDKDRNIQAWINKEGIGILHRNANDTIKQLEKYI